MPLEAMATYTVDYTGIPGHVYTLLLESGRFYVGWSSAVENRIAQHFSGRAASGRYSTNRCKCWRASQATRGSKTSSRYRSCASMDGSEYGAAAGVN